MLPRVGGGAAPGAAAVPPVAEPAPSPAFLRGRAAGQRHETAIRRWCRDLVAAGHAGGRVSAIDAEHAAFLAGVADAVGIDRSVLEAGMAAPARALGGLDIVVDLSGDDFPGILLGFGRHAEPVVREAAGGATLLAVAGLPDAVAAWNAAGIVALLTSTAGAVAAAALPRLVESCRSLADVDAAGPWPEGVVVISLTDTVLLATDGSGRLQPAPRCRREATPGSAVTRILLAAAPDRPLSALFTDAAGGLPAALSAAATWLAVGGGAGGPRSLAGGPLGAGDLVTAAASLARVLADHPLPHGPVPQDVARQAAPRPVTAGDAGITRRFGLTVRDVAPTGGLDLAGERVLVLGILGISAGANACGDRIRAAGGIPMVAGAGSVAEAVAAVQQAESAGAVRHLVLVTPTTAEPGWSTDGAASVAALYAACQRWITARIAAGDGARSTLTATTTLGGDFGLSGDIGWVGGGAITGLFKNLAHEFAELRVRVVDVPPAAAPAERAECVVAEIGAPGPVEIGWRQGRRLEPVPVAGGPVAGARLASLRPGSVWLVTGGARGVTAACALELGRRHGLHLVLVGSTRPEPVDPAWLQADEATVRDLKGRIMIAAKGRGADPRQAWRAVEKSIEIGRSLQAFHAAGVRARYEPCDLGDAAAVQRLVDAVIASSGPIRGIVHGAGWESACRFEKKTLEGLAATIGPKCLGLEHLLHATAGQPVEALVAFGSTSGRLGGHGQADYSLANDLLAKLVARARHGRRGLRATTFHWHAWDEVGMASRPESRFVLEQFGLKFMPLSEGVGRFMAEIEAGLPDAEVLVTEAKFIDGAAPGADAAPAERSPAVGSLVADVRRDDVDTEVMFRLDPTTDRFLIDHRQHGRPLLPAVMGLELLAQAVSAVGGADPVREFRDFIVARPIAFPGDVPREVRVRVGARPVATWRAEAWADAIDTTGSAFGQGRVHFAGTLSTGIPEPIAVKLDPPSLPFFPMAYQDDAPLWHGPSMRTLKATFLDRSGGWAKLVVPAADVVAAPRGAAGWTVPVAVLDGCIMACGTYSFVMCGCRVEIPVGIGRVRLESAAAPGESCVLRLFFRSQTASETVYDFVLYSADHRPILAVDGLRLGVMGIPRSGGA